MPSRVMPMSVSSVVTPIARALRNDAIVFSGASPRAPRWPSRSKADGRHGERDEEGGGEGRRSGASVHLRTHLAARRRHP